MFVPLLVEPAAMILPSGLKNDSMHMVIVVAECGGDFSGGPEGGIQ